MKKLLILCLISFSAYGEWKEENIKGLQTYLYLPKASSQKRSLMVNLHGCAQKAEDLKKDGNWEPTAEEYNMLVALPKVPNGGVYSGCWDYYGDDHTMSNRHNGPIIEMVRNLLSRPELNIDPNQVYVSGLSSGGGEAMVLGCLAPEIFAGIGLNAGPSTGTTANEIGRPKTSMDKMLGTCKKLAGSKSDFFKSQLTSIIYGSNDFIVNPLHDTNNAQIMSSIYATTSKTSFDTKKLQGSYTEGTGDLFSDQNGPRISLIMNSNLGHNWPAGQGGNAGNFISKKSINYPAYLAKFFGENNRRTKVKMPELTISSIDVENAQFKINGALNVPLNHVLEVKIAILESSTDSPVDYMSAAIDSNGHFQAFSKEMKSGEYKFSISLVKKEGVLEFIRKGWIGEIPGIMTPQLFNTNVESLNDCLSVKGQAVNNGGDAVQGVHVLIDEVPVGVAPVLATTFWSFTKCDLLKGEHNVGVFVENASGHKSKIQNYHFAIDTSSATATLQAHMEAGRLHWEDYGHWYSLYGNKTFTLYLWADGVWRDTKEP